MNTPRNLPLPWHCDGYGDEWTVYADNDWPVGRVEDGEAGERIVRAVNAHHAMLEALKLALDEIHHPGAARADGKDATALIEAAIAKAESPSNV
jgi:hypothetical protein